MVFGANTVALGQIPWNLGKFSDICENTVVFGAYTVVFWWIFYCILRKMYCYLGQIRWYLGAKAVLFGNKQLYLGGTQ